MLVSVVYTNRMFQKATIKTIEENVQCNKLLVSFSLSVLMDNLISGPQF